MRPHKYLILGAGRMARGLVHYLASADDGAQFHLVDIKKEHIKLLRSSLPESTRRRLTASVMDLSASSKILGLMSRCDVALSAAHYRFNRNLTRMAIATQCHMVDLGGNVDAVKAQLGLDAQARRKSVAIIPDCGLAPGMTNILALWAAGRLDRIDSIRIRVGGVPVRPSPPLNYMMVFSPEGLINEYIEDALAIRNGRVKRLPSLAEVEPLRFPPPFGLMEAFNTSGGSSTLVETLKGRVRHLDYKTIRYPGHCRIMQGLKQLGLFSSRPFMAGKTRGPAPRELAGILFENNLPQEGRDAVLVRVIARGTRKGRKSSVAVNLIDMMDRRSDLTAMMRCTAFPAACIAWMLAAGKITRRGVLPQEKAVPADAFVRAMRRAGLNIRIKTRNISH
ncbi:MAG: saccharopine dehydrogenase C-terminal domain-containing protein [Pseudomonadota bacterium]